MRNIPVSPQKTNLHAVVIMKTIPVYKRDGSNFNDADVD